MKEYNIGQVLYVLLKGDTTIHPILVVEELRKRTLQGATTEYTVEIVTVTGKGFKRNRVLLSELEATVFEDITVARSHLLRNTTDAINQICNNAQTLAEKWFNQPAPVQAVQQVIPSHEEEEEDIDHITLENGVKARIVVPPELR